MKEKLLNKFQTVYNRIKSFLEAYFKGEVKIPFWIIILIILGLLLLSLIIGLIFGYGVVGDGNKTDALKPSTWTHILDFLRK